MRFVVVGAGAVGSVVGSCLSRSNHDVLLVARGEHGGIVRTRGLRFVSPETDVTHRIATVANLGEVDWRDTDVALITVKSQDSPAVLDELRFHASEGVRVVCCQNGVENERVALRLFPRVYGLLVRLRAEFLVAGEVRVYAERPFGLLDIGRFPRGVDQASLEIATALSAAGFSSIASPDIMRWKYLKLLDNLGNAAVALFGEVPEVPGIVERAKLEAIECYSRAGIDMATAQEDLARREGIEYRVRDVAGRRIAGNSTWQGLERGGRASESDHLNGEICLIGRMYGVPTPMNQALQLLMARATREGWPPGSQSAAKAIELLASSESYVARYMDEELI